MEWGLTDKKWHDFRAALSKKTDDSKARIYAGGDAGGHRDHRHSGGYIAPDFERGQSQGATDGVQRRGEGRVALEMAVQVRHQRDDGLVAQRDYASDDACRA